MSRSRHPNKEVEEAVAEAEDKGWVFRPLGHWGRIFCPHHVRGEGCQVGIYGTPKNPENHAKQLKRQVNRCPHFGTGENDEDL